jgi:hypothetical protein
MEKESIASGDVRRALTSAGVRNMLTTLYDRRLKSVEAIVRPIIPPRTRT